MDRPALLWPLVIFVLALGVRLYFALWLSFPGLDDPAFYLKVAENLAQGRGLVIDAIWSYQAPFQDITHPSNEYWMPLTSLILAPFFWAFGSSFRVAQVVGAFAGAALALGTYYLALETWKVKENPQGTKDPNEQEITTNRVKKAGGVALLIAFNGLLVYQSVSGDSAVFFSLLTFLALLVLGKGSAGKASALAGILGGLSYLTRSDGILLLFAIIYRYIEGRGIIGGLRWPLSTGMPLQGPASGPSTGLSGWKWDRAKKGLAVALLAWGLVVGPWLFRNWTAFGTPFPVSFKAAALAQEYPDLFRYSPQGDTVEWGAFWELRARALYHNAIGVLNFALYPWAVLGLLGLFLLRGRPLFRPAILFVLLLFFATALVFPVPTMAGMYYHSVGSTLPFLAVAGIYALKRGSEVLSRRLGFVVIPQGGTNVWQRGLFPVFYLGILVITLIQLAWTQGTIVVQHKEWEGQFTEIAGWLEEHPEGAVMTDQPHTVHYVSGRPAVMLPAQDPPEVALEVARRYGVKYLIITQPFGLYPRILKSDPNEAFKMIYKSRAAEIYEVWPWGGRSDCWGPQTSWMTPSEAGSGLLKTGLAYVSARPLCLELHAVLI